MWTVHVLILLNSNEYKYTQSPFKPYARINLPGVCLREYNLYSVCGLLTARPDR